MTNKSTTSTVRAKESNTRKKAAGLIQAKVWVHPDETAPVHACAKKQPLTAAIRKGLGL